MNNQSKFTPGPWTVETADEMSTVYDKNGKSIADTYNFALGVEAAHANAALIAAAPELLAWTQELLKQVKQDNPDKLAGIIEHVEKLIARAGGSHE